MNTFAQQDCASAVDISALPYSATGLTTIGMLNDYSNLDACGSESMDNEDYVMMITPASDMQINVELLNTEIITDAFLPMANIGLFIIEGCPNASSTCTAYIDNVQANPSLNNVNISAGITYYIVISSANALMGESTNVNFDINITKNALDDVGVTSITEIASSCDLGSNTIECTIENYGLNDATGFSISYSINSQTAIDETYSLTIASGSTATYTFATPVDFSPIGVYNIQVYTSLLGDENPTNDETTSSVTHYPTINTFPSTEDFEADNGYWSTGGDATSWGYGNPDELNTELIINSAASGDNIWVTNLTGNTNTSEISYIESPCYDVSGLFLPTIELKAWINFSLYGNSGNIVASIDGGASWPIDIYTFEATDTWENISVQVPTLANQSNVKFRINYESGFLAANGIAIDDFTVKESVLNDAGVVDIMTPTSGCGLTDTETITIIVKNYGAQNISDIVVDYSIDGGITWLTSTETIATTIIPGGTYMYDFTTTVDLSTIGNYEIVAKTVQSGDEDNTNDEFEMTVISQETITAADYLESFETNNGGWYAYGDNSTMELAIPSNTLINAAGDGVYAWVTNAIGNNHSNEISYLESPCFDFTGMTNPILKAMIQYETTQMTSNFYIEYSIDNGASWDTIQAGGAATNWYGTGLIPIGTWSGSSEGWLQISTDVPELIGQSSVKLRFVFNNGTFAIGDTEGVAIDLINISDCNDLPSASFTYTVEGTEVIFTNESENGTAYEWNFGDNEFMPSTSTEENPSFSYMMDGTYTVSLTVTNECGSDEHSAIIDIITNINSVNNVSGIYPNPANDYLYVEYQNLRSYQIININGQIVASKDVNTNTVKINIKDLPAGIYFIQSTTANDNYTQQFVIE